MINNLPDNMLAKIRVAECLVPGLEGMCWEWTGCLNSKGYGCVQIDKKRHLTHRASYQLHIGDIPDGLTLDHLCRNKKCCNPHHLEPVSVGENVRRHLAAQTADRIAATVTLDYLDDEERQDLALADYFAAVEKTGITHDPYLALAKYREWRDAAIAAYAQQGRSA